MEKIPILKPFMPPGLGKKLNKVLYSGWIGEGPQVKKFEEKFKKYLGAKYVLCVNSGTSALWLACHLANLKPGDEVITTPMTCSATNIPFLHFGARIVWADIDANTGNISPDSIESRITNKTRLICVVDYGGTPCDIGRIRKIAKKHKIKVLEDAAQALGAEYKNKKIGTHNEYVCFSLQAVKTITSVDGGILCLKSRVDYLRAKRLRWFGIDRENKYKKVADWRYDIKEAGYKMHMNDVLATIGATQLKNLKSVLKCQRANAQFYNKKLSGLREIKVLQMNSESKSSFWLFVLLVKNRSKFIKTLKTVGVQSTPLHQRNDKLSIFGPVDTSLKQVKYFDDHSVCIPNGYWVNSKKRNIIVGVILRNFK